ncbi:MAG: response regulator [Lachnospiraceae bacterium]|nr:response regulator [Lachnospiraceae bacterium]
MKKILLMGKFNEVLKDIDKALSSFFHVQLCEIKLETVDGMMQVVEPELVIISLVGTQDYDMNLFMRLADRYSQTPVLTIGTESEKRAFLKFYQDDQFDNLIRPVDNTAVLNAVAKKLNLEYLERDGKGILNEKSTRKNVLIVDDDPVTLRSIREMLSEDFEVTVATSGIQAMTAIGKKRPDLILLDYEMPVCDGKQTLEMIRADEELKDMPVIFLTGINDRAHIQSVLKLKPEGYLLKPAVRDELVSTIRKRIVV